MKRTVVLLLAVAFVAPASLVVAQARPNFSGTWAMVPDPKAAGRPDHLALGPTITIEQTAKSLTVTTVAGKITCSLDGTAVQIGLALSKAKWDKEKLIIEFSRRGSDEDHRDWGHRLYLDGSGQLVVETWEHSQRGAPSPRVVYRKQ